MEWIKTEFERSQSAHQDLIFLAHHDPRGGHKGNDYPYYFKQYDFAGVGTNFSSYLKSEVLKGAICDGPFAQLVDGNKRDLFCTHDGLQEWMRSDKEYDCSDRIKKPDGKCDACLFSRKERPYYSGYELVDLWAKTENLRTIILGHTHFHSLEILQSGDDKTSELVPRHVVLDAAAQETAANIDPARQAAATQDKKKAKTTVVCPNYQENAEAYTRLPKGTVMPDGTHLSTERYELNLDKAGFGFKSRVQGSKRELVIIRVAPSADITGQRVVEQDHRIIDADTKQSVSLSGQHMHGFSVFDIFSKHDSRDYDFAQVNALHYYVDVEEVIEEAPRKGETRKGGQQMAAPKKFIDRIFNLGEFTLDRTQSLKRTDRAANPVYKLVIRHE